ncbi:hypothetical protein APR41_06810 [Salegentibacter salinarum]|uniref:DUF4249 domain-containing protein n=1 Tax=Salegentibacter salinarum TaxID=447422 RepID=A0A2N0TR14_9FLAO|nr:DUF4249 domain-containing protein [Salegentibacter salinarum]PKD17138.1 hypothetical protein APR41_06810 [Salegentibacter salinarum]SKB55523.1 protein of unknown function [Salegentibacter salinarum]
MTSRSKYSALFLLLAFVVFISSCVEEIPLDSENFEDAIVIEALVTNELKKHEVKLSQAFEIDSTGPNPLAGADIRVTGDRDYVFQEVEPGRYLSIDSFAAHPGIEYQLNIRVDDREFRSEPTKLSGNSDIGELEANRINYRGEDGVAITLTNESSPDGANYYKYEYVETFKFNSNYQKFKDLILVDGEPVEVPKQKEEYTCYQTNDSQEIIVANTNSLSEDSVNNLLIKFIDSKNPSLSNRYSLLIKQYVISRKSYNYYKILEELSGSDNIFSQSQPGFFDGNIQSTNNPDENVIGFFNVSSVATKRIYFNYGDFYDPQGIRPRFVSFDLCEETFPDYATLISELERNAVRWSGVTPGGGFLVVPRICVDCTLFGTNEKPDFWED